MSPSTSVTVDTETTSPSLSPWTEMVGSSRSNHSLPQFKMFLFFQCQFAVEGGRAMELKSNNINQRKKNQISFYLHRVCTIKLATF